MRAWVARGERIYRMRAIELPAEKQLHARYKVKTIHISSSPRVGVWPYRIRRPKVAMHHPTTDSGAKMGAAQENRRNLDAD